MEFHVDKMILNPLLKNKLEIEIEDELIELDTFTISKYFKKIYILVPMKNCEISSKIYSREISKKDWLDLEHKLVLEESTTRLLKNDSFNHNLCIASGKEMNMFNHFGLELDEKIIVIPIFFLSYKNLKQYLKI